MHTVYFSLGANLGDRQQTMCQAIEQLEARIGAVVRRSSLHETNPWGFQSANKFLNAAVCCATELSPHEVLNRTQEIERSLGRTHKTHNRQYHDRAIDIDILLFDDLHIHEDNLTIPHPLMHERDFVMAPLQEILPR